MKRIAAALFIWILSATLLCGCRRVLPDQTIVCREITITLPGDFEDLSHQTYAQDVEMVYGADGIVISAIAEPADELALYFPNIDAEQYAQLVIRAYDLSGDAQMVDGIPSFTYTVETGDMEITYLVGVFASDTHFWMVQAYCSAEEYPVNQPEMWEYISSVTAN